MVFVKSSAMGTLAGLPFSIWTAMLIHERGITKDMIVHHPMEVRERLKGVENKRLGIDVAQGLTSGFITGLSGRLFSSSEEQAFQVLVFRLAVLGFFESAAALTSATSGVNLFWVPLDVIIGPLAMAGGCMLGHTFGPSLLDAISSLCSRRGGSVAK